MILQDRVNEYFGAFAGRDVDRVMSCLSDDFHQDDFRKLLPYPFLLPLSLTSNFPAVASLGLEREGFPNSCHQLFGMMSDMHMVCLPIQGSSAPDSFAAVEWVMSFELKGGDTCACAWSKGWRERVASRCIFVLVGQ